MIDYIFKRYGRDHVCLLGAYKTFQPQAILRELGKVLGLPSEEIDQLEAGRLKEGKIQRQIKAEELRQIVADGAQITAELSSNRRRVEYLEQQETSSRPELRARLIDIYKLGQGRYLRLLLSTTDIRQVGQASRILATLAKLDGDRIVTRQRTLAELKKTRAALAGGNAKKMLGM